MNANQLTQLFRDDEGVSPVIGVILMVAVTVILAAVIGAFVMGMGDNLSKSAPQANLEFEATPATATSQSGDVRVDVTHAGGDSITDANTLKITGTVNGVPVLFQVDSSDSPKGQWVGPNGDTSFPVSAGDTARLIDEPNDGSPTGEGAFESGDEIRIIWTADNGQSSQTIAQYTV